MADVDDFTPISSVTLPGGPVYALHDPDRGDAMSNWSPDEALPAITGAARTPLTLFRGIALAAAATRDATAGSLLHDDRLAPPLPAGSLDARTPAVWISNGTGRDSAARRDAPTVGWCWPCNRHTWLGFASAAGRFTVDA